MSASHSPFVIPRMQKIGFGGDWNPEQWPEEIWDQDIDLMQTAHVNLVTVGVFSWAHLEPTPGVFAFDWLDRVLDKCAAGGINVDLATATASPPPWLGHLWPETLPVTDSGVRLSYGARQQYCPSSKIYQERAVALTEKIASRYADHDAVVMWHVNNEYGAHTPMCWCDNSAEAFRSWLQKRHPDLDSLNSAWSTAFWSQRFSDWDEVIPPRKTPYFPNPTQQLDFKRFSSDAMMGLFTAERDVIRAVSPTDKPITTNFMRFFPHNDYWEWAKAEDLVSDDWYPDLTDPKSHIEGAAGADLMRSLKNGQPWLLMEQAVSAINWRAINPPKPIGAYRRWSLQQVARGADAILHFQWRASVGGAEKWHSGMLPHAGPRTRSWDDVVSLGAELDSLSAVTGARTNAKIAIVFDWSSWWALELDSRPSTHLSQMQIVLSWYEQVWKDGHSIDFVHPEGDLGGYSVLLVPQLYSVTDVGAQKIIDASAGGASVVIGFFSGATDHNDRVRPGGYPAPWQELLGIWIEEYCPVLPEHTMKLQGEIQSATGSQWSEHIHLTDAQPMLTYASGDLDGKPAVTKHSRNNAWYISTQLDERALQFILRDAITTAGVEPILGSFPPAGIEVAERHTDSERFIFLLNHSDDSVNVSLPPGDWQVHNHNSGQRESVEVLSRDVVVVHTKSGRK
jgi:beta-galactosidase